MVIVCVQRRQVDAFTGLPEAEVYSFNLLSPGTGAAMQRVLDDIYGSDDSILDYHLIDAKYQGTLADYRRNFGRDGQRDRRRSNR